MFTYQGYMKIEYKGLQSTKPDMNISAQDLNDCFPALENPNAKSNQVYYTIIDPQSIVTAYVDLTDCFPKRSLQGNKCILVGYHFDSNYMHDIPIKSR